MPLRVTFIASGDGTRLRTANWEPTPGIPRRGYCVLLDGHSEFIEKYEEVVGELAARGFAGAILDWRGQGASQRDLTDPLKAHVTDFNAYDADLRAFMEQIAQSTASGQGQPIALAHSMGAHILLRMLHANPESFSAAILIAPMLELDTQSFPGRIVRSLASTLRFLGLSRTWVWGMRKRDPIRLRFEDNRVTSDRDRFARTQNQLERNPALRLAGPSWGWLEAAYRSMAAMRRPGFAENITTPCLMFGAGRDRIVSTAAVRAFSRRLPHVTYIELADAEHEILMEKDSIREGFWSAFDVFVGQICPWRRT
ncbi:MAG TPA: alpha/beta hydrolase [Rhizomicrobium sp.]